MQGLAMWRALRFATAACCQARLGPAASGESCTCRASAQAHLRSCSAVGHQLCKDASGSLQQRYALGQEKAQALLQRTRAQKAVARVPIGQGASTPPAAS